MKGGITRKKTIAFQPVEKKRNAGYPGKTAAFLRVRHTKHFALMGRSFA